MSLVEFKDVYKIYKMGEVTINAVEGVSFNIEQGEFCVVVGASGFACGWPRRSTTGNGGSYDAVAWGNEEDPNDPEGNLGFAGMPGFEAGVSLCLSGAEGLPHCPVSEAI